MFRPYDQQLHLERWYRVSMPAVYLLRWISYITCSCQFSQKNFEISAMIYGCQLCFYLRAALLLQHGVQDLNTVKLSPCRTVLVSYSRCHLRWCSSLCRHLSDCICPFHLPSMLVRLPFLRSFATTTGFSNTVSVQKSNFNRARYLGIGYIRFKAPPWR